MLASFGVETAADVEWHKVEAIPGFGATLTANLAGWRKEQEAGFRFDPGQPVETRRVAALDRELSTKRAHWIEQLQQGPSELQRIAAHAVHARERFKPVLEAAANARRAAMINAKR
jgi:DNA-binding helix-hairpin-helix protein with protein kinase domain